MLVWTVNEEVIMDDVQCSMRILRSNCPLTNDSNDGYFVFLNLKGGSMDDGLFEFGTGFCD